MRAKRGGRSMRDKAINRAEERMGSFWMLRDLIAHLEVYSYTSVKTYSLNSSTIPCKCPLFTLTRPAKARIVVALRKPRMRNFARQIKSFCPSAQPHPTGLQLSSQHETTPNAPNLTLTSTAPSCIADISVFQSSDLPVCDPATPYSMTTRCLGCLELPRA
jgi:hypothetical protein